MGPKNKDKNPEQILAEKKQQLAAIQRQCAVYEQMLSVCTDQLQRAHAEKATLRRSILEVNEKFSDEENLTVAMTRDMNRAYRTNQHQLVGRIETHQAAVHGLRAELDAARQTLEQTKLLRDAACGDTQRRIQEQRQRMEEMAVAFGSRLKQTLEQMASHVAARGGGGGAAAAASSSGAGPAGSGASGGGGNASHLGAPPGGSALRLMRGGGPATASITAAAGAMQRSA